MSTDQREEYGVLSRDAVTVVNHLRRSDGSSLAAPHEWIQQVEARAIAAFVADMSADYRKHTAEGVHEDLVVSCARFGVDPKWYFTDEDGTVDETSTRELRADVAYYRIMHGLDEGDE